MRQTLSLIRREFAAYFTTGIGFVVLVPFLVVTGFLFWLTLDELTAASPRGVTSVTQILIASVAVLIFIPPLLTMRLFAEERSTGTLEMLLTAPLRDLQIVLAKFVACFLFYVLMWLPTLLYLPVLLDAGFKPGSLIIQISNDPWPILSTYLGLALAGAMFLALGMLVSSLVKSQIVSAILAMAASLPFFILGYIHSFRGTQDYDPGDLFASIQYYLSVPLHFRQNFGQGLIDTRNLVLYVSVTLVCIYLTIRSLESRRWR